MGFFDFTIFDIIVGIVGLAGLVLSTLNLKRKKAKIVGYLSGAIRQNEFVVANIEITNKGDDITSITDISAFVNNISTTLEIEGENSSESIRTFGGNVITRPSILPVNLSYKLMGHTSIVIILKIRVPVSENENVVRVNFKHSAGIDDFSFPFRDK